VGNTRVSASQITRKSPSVCQPVAQVTGLKADVGLASDIVNAFLFANGFHLRATAVIKDVDAVVNRERVGHLHGVTNGQPDQLGVFGVGGNEQIHLNGTGLYGLLRRQAVVNLLGGGLWGGSVLSIN
jgi:hypothetical protein